MKKILIATDGSPSALQAVELGLELVAEQEAEAVFVHVARHGGAPGDRLRHGPGDRAARGDRPRHGAALRSRGARE